MWILIVYVLIVVVGEAVVVTIGLALDRIFPLASLPVSLSLFFAVLAFGWPLAVRWTPPRTFSDALLGICFGCATNDRKSQLQKFSKNTILPMQI